MSNTVTVTEVRTSGWRTDAIVEGRYGNVVGSSAYGYWHLAIERVTGHGALYIGTIEESGRCLFAATQGVPHVDGDVCKIGSLSITDTGRGSVALEGEVDWRELGADRDPNTGGAMTSGRIRAEWRAGPPLLETTGGIRPVKTEASCEVRLEVVAGGEHTVVEGLGYTDHGWDAIDYDRLGGWDWVFIAAEDASWVLSATSRADRAGARSNYGWFRAGAAVETIHRLELSSDTIDVETVNRSLHLGIERRDHFPLRSGPPDRRGPLDETFCRFSTVEGLRAVGVVESLTLP